MPERIGIRHEVVGARERARRCRILRASIGRQIDDLRTEAGVTRAALARAADLDPAHLLRIEAGLANASFEALVALAATLGADVSVRLFSVSGPRIHDRLQAPMIDALVRALHRSWSVNPEFPVPDAHGVIDLVMRRRHVGLAVACECHSELRRLEQVVRRANDKAAAFRHAEGDEMIVSQLLLLRSTRETRAVVNAYQATLAAAYPARTADAVAALTGNAAWPGSAIVWARVEAGRAEILDGPPRGVRLGR